MKFSCKVWPVESPHPAFPKEKYHWAPLLNVRLIYRHSPMTRTIECWIDSGAHVCMFHADLCHPLGIKRLEDGIEDDLRGIVVGPKAKMYFHRVKVVLAGDQFETMAAFSRELTVVGLLGRRGFFDNFVVAIDPTTSTAICEITKVHRT